jgi:signal peptidase I
MSSSSGATTGTGTTRGSSTARRATAGPARGIGHRLSGVAVALGCVLFLGSAVWGAVVYRPYTVPTGSMAPTVRPGDRVLAQKVSGSEVHRGDVVVFQDELWGSEPLVKRVVAVGGDLVACCDAQGRLTVNGKPVEEAYVKGGAADAGSGGGAGAGSGGGGGAGKADGSGEVGGSASLDTFRTRVPAGKLFLLGDNRAVSEDSRFHLEDAEGGAVPAADVKGRVDGIAWPSSRMGLLPRTSAFDALAGGGAAGRGPLGMLVVAALAGVVLILGGAAYDPVAKLLRRR